jgi:hypothetical protein
MKKITMLLLGALTMATIYIVACKKETDVQVMKESLRATEEMSERSSNPIFASVSPICSCRPQVCNVIGAIGSNRNGINISLTAATHNLYNVSGVGLNYKIFQGINCSGNLIANFNCTLQNVKYVSSLLNNNTIYYVKITSVANSTLALCDSIGTGICVGMPCLPTSGQ